MSICSLAPSSRSPDGDRYTADRSRALSWSDCCSAFSQVMVVVKYLFQFGFFPWNGVYEMTLNEDKPFFPPRILGLEKTDNYIRYDLIQLLALFFHRSLLMVSGGDGYTFSCQ